MNRGRASWAIAYAYLAYVFVSEIPRLSTLWYFSVQSASILLIILFLLSSYALWGWQAATKYLVGTWLISYFAEYVGVETGYPFGHYAYTAAMSPFIGPVPLVIPFTWCALGYFCLQAGGRSIAVPALLMVVLDVALDPVLSLTLWHWRASPGHAYFGIPVLNFVGWFVTSIVIFAAFSLLARDSWMEKKKTMFASGGSPEAVGFYFLFGMSTVPSLADSGFLGAAAISATLFGVVGALLWSMRARGDRSSGLEAAHGGSGQPLRLDRRLRRHLLA